MTTITTTFATGSASKYLQQLCKHFAHKVPASWDSTHGQVTFEPGLCTLVANDTALTIKCTADSPDKLQSMIYIVEVHLIRFAWREPVDLTWTNDQGQTVMKAAKVIEMLAPAREKFSGKQRN